MWITDRARASARRAASDRFVFSVRTERTKTTIRCSLLRTMLFVLRNDDFSIAIEGEDARVEMLADLLVPRLASMYRGGKSVTVSRHDDERVWKAGHGRPDLNAICRSPITRDRCRRGALLK